jgi:hypothetical protein
MKEGSRGIRAISLQGIPQRGPGGRAPLLGTPKDILSKAQKWVSASIGAPLLGNLEGYSFLGAFLFRGICMRFSRVVDISLHRGPVGEPERGSFDGIFERKEKVYLRSFLGPRGY